MALVDREDMSREIRSLRHRAEQVRTTAKDVHDPYSRRSLLLMALSYDRMARHLETAVAHLSLKKAG
jgi:hypothetical protein